MTNREKFAQITFGHPTVEIAQAVDVRSLAIDHGGSAQQAVALILLEPDIKRRAQIVKSLPRPVRVIACRALLG